MNTELYDVLIVGAGPAGATAAIFLARQDRSVMLVDRAEFPKPVPCAGWISGKSVELFDELGVDPKKMGALPFGKVSFYRSDFSESARPSFENAPGFLVDRPSFDRKLFDMARKAGATVQGGCEVVDLRLKEDRVVAQLAGGALVEAKLLLLAAGRQSPLLDRVSIPGVDAGSVVWTAMVEEVPPKGAGPAEPEVAVVLGLDRGPSFAFCCSHKKRVFVGVHWHGDRAETVPKLVLACRGAAEHGVVPIDLSKKAAMCKPLSTSGAAAMEMDSHVGKHTLVIGEAGGFVTAASQEGIYPAMWSAQIAAEVALEALQGVHSQDQLMQFNSVWRMRMADYLRSPHTDIQFLLPLVFTNQPMADRMGAAFFSGENI